MENNNTRSKPGLPYAIPGEKEKVFHFSDIKHKLISGQQGVIPKNNLFLGNGFNLSINIDTGYPTLLRELLAINEVKAECGHLQKSYDAGEFGMEKLLSREKDSNTEQEASNGSGLNCIEFVRKEFFQLILEKSDDFSNKNISMMLFLANFSRVFTTNYDPVLYRIYNFIEMQNKRIQRLCRTAPLFDKTQKDKLSLEEKIKILRKFIAAIEKLWETEVRIFTEPEEISSLDDRPLASELIYYMLPEDYQNRVSRLFVRDLLAELHPETLPSSDAVDGTTIEKLMRKPHLEKDDGFRRKRKVGLIWTGPEEQNLFYLHGALHLHTGQEQNSNQKSEPTKKELLNRTIYKLERKTGEKLQDTLFGLRQKHICVFREKDKKCEVAVNPYLLDCHEKLESTKGPLCIIGWKCDENDQYLAQAIDDGPDKTIFASVHLELAQEQQGEWPDTKGDLIRDKEALETIANFRSHFKKKKVVFFEANSIDYG